MVYEYVSYGIGFHHYYDLTVLLFFTALLSQFELHFVVWRRVGRAGRMVTCGSVIKLQNLSYKIRLHSHDVKYGSGSGQQSVTGTDQKEDVNSHWAVLGPINETCKRGSSSFLFYP